MGLFRVPVKFASLDRSRRVTIEAIVDSGAVYSKLPRPVIEALGLVPEGRVRVRLGDNRFVDRELAPAWIQCHRIPR